jgi:hypothetical protein
MAASVGGGLLQSFGGKKNQISPEWLKKHFGAERVNNEMIALFNQLINSPYGQSLMTNAAEQGNQFQTDISRRAAAAGFGPSGGAESGASIFSQAASGGAVNSLQRGVRSDMMQAALPIAQQIVQGQMNAAVGAQMQDQQQPSAMQMFGSQLAGGANMALAAGAGGGSAKPGVPQASLKQAGMEGAQMGVGSAITPRGSLAAQGPITPPNTTMPPRRRGYFSRLGQAIMGGGGRMATSNYGR